MKLITVVAGLYEEEGNLEKVSFRIVPEETWLPSFKGYKAFASRSSTLKDILNALSDPDVNMVGVYGMGGVGKTTLVKEVAAQAKDRMLFDEIVFVQVSENPNVRKIQGEIADKLGLRFREESESGRARTLWKRLKQENKTLIILDNIWGSLDLETVGIPFGDDHKGRKLLLTARSLDVLSNKMESQNNFHVGVLNEEEAWSLFKNSAGACIEQQSDDSGSIAISVVKACGGLPIAIVTIAKALKNKEMYEWKNALQELNRPSMRNFQGVAAEAYSSIEFSYRQLKDEELKSTFLLCSLMGYTSDASVENLLRYGVGLGIFKSVNTIEEVRDRVKTLVRKLEYSSLLLDTSDGMISMHDVARDVARSIVARDHFVFTVTNDVVPRDLVDKDTMKNCRGIYLHGINELPQELECPQLRFFYMKTKETFSIPDNFFKGMPELKVLHLIGMDSLSLPTSLRLLVNLRMLCLSACMLEDVAIIGDLERLEILSLSYCDIEQLPEEIGRLTHLRLLDLSNCLKLRVIPPNIISSLTQLEALYTLNTCIQWEVGGLNMEIRSNASLDELKHLSCLGALEIHIRDANTLPKWLFSEKLERYRIFIGEEWNNWVWHKKYETSKTLRLKQKLNTSSDVSFDDDGFIITQLKGIRDLYLGEFPGVRNVLLEDMNGFSELKYLRVKNNPYFRFIVDTKQSVSCVAAFPLLESFILKNLINLEKICSGGGLTSDSFCKLRIIKVKNCDKLKNVLCLYIARGLVQLERIEIIECKNVKEIFATDREDDDRIHFSQLRYMTLRSLPQLKSFCSFEKSQKKLLAADTRTREIISEGELDITTPLFNKQVGFQNLEILELFAVGVVKIWQNQLAATSACVQNLTRLIVEGCYHLRNLFSSSTIRSFVHLQHLEIYKCRVLEEIIIVTDEELREEERKDYVSFPRLTYLKIEDLKNLKRLYSGNYIEIPSLKQLVIGNCPKMKPFIFNDKVAFPSLQKIRIFDMDNLETIWHSRLAEHSFCKLKSIQVKDCQKLLTVFPSNVCIRFLRLESLKVRNCGSLLNIFDLRRLNFEETHSIVATQLREVDIFNLSKLEHIWNKDPQGLLSFQELLVMKVTYCESLKNVFPASVARSLLKLEKLEITRCNGVKEIVAKEGVEEAAARFLFPQVTSLMLAYLPELRTFYPGIHSLEWPVLQSLELSGCNEVEIFTSEFLSFHEMSNDEEGQLDISVPQPLFMV